MFSTNFISIHFASPESLNFAIFVGCTYSLIQNQIDELWPDSELAIHKNIDINKKLLRSQWNKWWGDLVQARSIQLSTKSRKNNIDGLFEPPDFLSLEHAELRQCCEIAWPHFSKWWNMIGGGKNALSFYEKINSENLSKSNFGDSFESGVARKKPFVLQIDHIYTGFPNIIDVSPEYIIAIPDLILNNKDFLREKILR